MVAGQHPAGALQGAADDLAEIVRGPVRGDGAGLEPGHVEQIGDEAIQPFRFGEDGGEEVCAGFLAQVVGEVAQRAGRPDDGGERRAQVVGDRGEQRLAQPVGLGGAHGALHVLDQVDPLDGDGRLIGERVEQTALLGGQQRTRALGVEADDADGAASGAERHEEAAGAGQVVGAAAGGPVGLEAPLARRRCRRARACPRADSRRAPRSCRPGRAGAAPPACRAVRRAGRRWPRARRRAC